MINYNSLSYDQRIVYIWQNIQVLISLIGIIGNTLTICVFSRKRLRNTSYSFYFRVLAGVDNLLLAQGFRHWSRIVLGFDIDLVSPFLCQFNEYLPYVASIVFIWLLTVILIERLVCIVKRSALTLFKTKWFQFTLVFCIFIYSLIVHSILPLNYRLEEVNQTNLSVKMCHIPSAINQINFHINGLNIFANFVINSVLNVKLISLIYKCRRGIENRRRQSDQFEKDLKFATSTIILNGFYVFSRIPFGFGIVWIHLKNLTTEQYQVVFTICVTLTFAYNGSLLFVNLLFNSVFKKEFLTMIRYYREES